MKRGFKYQENTLRKRFKRDDRNERFLDTLNELLCKMELEPLDSPKHDLPILFILGLQRSGTTLLNQVLVHCFDVGYINNLIARFWLAPVTGIRLSRILLGDRKHITFQSVYGKTSDITEPHEFSYFWHHWLKMENMPPYDPVNAAERIDWRGLETLLRRMGIEFGKPLVMKASDVSYHLPQVSHILPESVFVHMHRDLADVAVSIRKSRYEYYGNYDTWLGSYPIEYEEIKDYKDVDQIARQVYYLDKMTSDNLRGVDARRIVSIDLRDLCENPKSVLDRVRDTVSEYAGFALQHSNDPPEEFRFAMHRDSPGYEELSAIINQLKSAEDSQNANHAWKSQTVR